MFLQLWLANVFLAEAAHFCDIWTSKKVAPTVSFVGFWLACAIFAPRFRHRPLHPMFLFTEPAFQRFQSTKLFQTHHFPHSSRSWKHIFPSFLSLYLIKGFHTEYLWSSPTQSNLTVPTSSWWPRAYLHLLFVCLFVCLPFSACTLACLPQPLSTYPSHVILWILHHVIYRSIQLVVCPPSPVHLYINSSISLIYPSCPST